MKKILFIITVLLIFISCSQDKDMLEIQSQDKIRIKASVGSLTRVATYGISSYFEDGDQIMVYGWTDNNTVTPPIASVNTLSIENDIESWNAEPQMMWQNPTDKHYFLGIYPVRKPQDFTADPYTLDVENQEESDLLVAVNDEGLVANGKDVELAFDHLMAKIHVNLHLRTHVVNWDLQEVRFFGDTEATISYLTKEVNCGPYQHDDNKYINLPALEKPESGFHASYATIVIPQKGVRRIDVRIAGYTYSFKSNEDIPLESGKITTINLNVDKDEIALAGVTVGGWNEGETLEGGEAEEVISALNSPADGTIAADPALLDEYLNEAGKLVVTGILNDEDMVAIGDWAIRKANDGTAGNDLLYLDLSNVTGITATPEGMFYKALDGSYQGSDLLKEIILPISVTRIGKNTFLDCEALEKVTAEGVEYVEEQAFANCHALTRFVGSKIKHIESSGFFHSTALKSLDLSNLESTGASVFQFSHFDSFYAPKLKKVENGLFAYSTLSGITIDLPVCTELGNKLFNNVESEFTLRLTTKDDITLTNMTLDGAGVDIASTITLYLHENKKNNLPEYLDRYTFKAIKYVDDAGNVVE